MRKTDMQMGSGWWEDGEGYVANVQLKRDHRDLQKEIRKLERMIYDREQKVDGYRKLDEVIPLDLTSELKVLRQRLDGCERTVHAIEEQVKRAWE